MKPSSATLCSIFLFSVFTAAQQPVTAAFHPPMPQAATAETLSPDKIWTGLMEGNERFASGAPMSRPLQTLRASLAKSQHPHVIVLACSDSRVAPELIFDQSLGDLFVVRVAGNISDAISEGSMEYAVEHLGSSVLVVLGHSKCGAVTAACSGDKMPTSNLQALVDRISPAVAQVGDMPKGDAFVEASVKQNVHQSAKDVLANSEVLRHASEQGKLTVYEAEYNIETGKVTRLDLASTSH